MQQEKVDLLASFSGVHVPPGNTFFIARIEKWLYQHFLLTSLRKGKGSQPCMGTNDWSVENLIFSLHVGNDHEE